MGARDVTVTNPDGQPVVLTGGFAVAPPPPTLGLAFLGKLRDKVGRGNTAFSADSAFDGSFRVTVQAGSGARTVTRLELRSSGGVWDTDPATAHWALGAAGSLDGGLLNSGTGTVSFGVADGGTFFVFAADPSSVFTSGVSFTLTANFADGASASASASVPFMPTISSVSPSTGLQGANLTVTVTGTNFQAGASAAFGAGITVGSTVVSSTQLSVALAIEATAAMGPRDVTVSNPDGQSVVLTGGFTVTPPPPTLSLAFLGKLRDRVGQSNSAFSADGALDGTFRVTVQAGSFARTVTRLELRTGGGVWDTDLATAHWALGASTSLDGALLNAGNGTVSFGVADGGAFFVFASAVNPTAFSSGASFTLTANFADGTSASATVSVPLTPTIASVSPSSGVQGASLTVTVTGTNFQAGASASFGAGITVSSTTVASSTQLSVALAIGATAAMGARDVTVSNPDGQTVVLTGGFTIPRPPPTLGLAFLGKLRDKVGQGNTAFSADSAFDGSFRVTVQAGSGARTVTRLELRSSGGVWDTDPATAHWALGAAGSLDGGLLNAGTGTVSFGVADGGTFFVFAADPSSVFTSGASFTLTANFADGTSATATSILPNVPTISSVSPSTGLQGANLTVTVTGTSFHAGASAAFGAGITATSTTVVSSTQLSVALVIGATAAMGARDVTVTNPDGQTVVLAGGFAVTPPPPTLGLAFLGKLRDKVGQGNTAFSADGALDGSFRVTVGAGSGARTVTRLELSRAGGGGVWDTDPATANWALGASAGLDGALLNSGTGTVSFGVADGGAFLVFASDLNPTVFGS